MEASRPEDDRTTEDGQFGGIAACVLFIPAVVIVALGMYFLLANLKSGERWHEPAQGGGALFAAGISGVIAALGLAIAVPSLNERVDRSKWAILGIALNSPLVVAGVGFGIMALRTLWPGTT